MVTVSCHTIYEIMHYTFIVKIAKSCWELLAISYLFIINLSKTLMNMIMYALVKSQINNILPL